MPDSLLPVIVGVICIIVGVAVGFVITRYLANSSTKRAAEEARQLVSDAERQAETMRREAVVEAKARRRESP